MNIQLETNSGVTSIVIVPDTHDIAEFITFENSHLVAQALTSNPEAARALYNELSYWIDNDQI